MVYYFPTVSKNWGDMCPVSPSNRAHDHIWLHDNPWVSGALDITAQHYIPSIQLQATVCAFDKVT